MSLTLCRANLEATVEAEWILAFLFPANTRYSASSMSYSQGRLAKADLCYVSSFALSSSYSLQKNYDYIPVFEFVKVMSKVLSVPFFPDTV